MIDDDEGRRLPQGWRIVAGVVGLALAYGAWHLISAGPTQETVPAPPSETLARPAPKPQAPPPAQAETESVPAPAKTTAAAPAVSAPVAPPPAAPPPPAPKAATNIDASPPGTAARATGGTVTPSPAVPAVPGSAAIAPSTGRVYGAGNRTARIILRAKGDTHIEVRDSDGTVFINRNLKEGDVYRVPNVPGLSLSTTNAGAVAVEMDGQIMGRAGAENETAGDINLDPQAIADRANR
jgi:cytoskeleton protein RodZ